MLGGALGAGAAGGEGEEDFAAGGDVGYGAAGLEDDAGACGRLVVWYCGGMLSRDSVD